MTHHVIDETPPTDRNESLRILPMAILVAILWTGLIGWTVSECRGAAMEVHYEQLR